LDKGLKRYFFQKTRNKMYVVASDRRERSNLPMI
jgi:hypothetical protein